MGGFIGIELAIRFPERVERLVLVSAAGLSIEYLRNERALAVLGALGNRLAAYSGWVASRSDALARRPVARRAIFGIVAHRPDRLPGPLVAEQVRGSGKPGFIPALDALTDYPIRDRLGEIACPTLIVWGAEDKLVPARDADEFARLIPNSRKVVWPETGHVAMLERPEAFNALVQAFLAEEPGERVGPQTRRGRRRRAGAGQARGRGRSAAPRRSAHRDGALGGAADELRVLRQHAGAVGVRGRLVGGHPARDLVVVERDVHAPRVDVDGDDVAVAHGRDRAAARRLGRDVAGHEAVGGAGEASVGQQRDVLPQARADDGAGHPEHLAHARSAGRALVADDDHVAGRDLAAR